MIIHSNEIMEPEDLARLGKAFDEAWAAVSITAGEDRADQRTTLAFILLRLASLRQLGPDQIKDTALRIFRAEVAPPTRPHLSDTEAAGCLASAHPLGA